ncbi:MAG: precorrin-6A synthase (deacetylating) [Roseinatronobacter sp.]
MFQLSLIGIGSGHADHLTGAAIRALNDADLILLPAKGEEKAQLLDLRRALLADMLTRPIPQATFDMPTRRADIPYLDAVNDWHDQIAARWLEAIRTHLPQGGRVALLVWGDPSLYDSTLRIAARAGDVAVQVIPGLTSLQMLTAAHAVPLNTLGGAVMITTGRMLRDHGWPLGAESVAVMLDAGGAYEVLDPDGLHIWWGAYLGLPQQALIVGPLADVADQIKTQRATLRAQNGWIMDIYLLRRGGALA